MTKTVSVSTHSVAHSVRSTRMTGSTMGTSRLLLLFSSIVLIAFSIGLYAQANTYAYGSSIAWQYNFIAAVMGAFSCLVFSAFLMWKTR